MRTTRRGRAVGGLLRRRCARRRRGAAVGCGSTARPTRRAATPPSPSPSPSAGRPRRRCCRAADDGAGAGAPPGCRRARRRRRSPTRRSAGRLAVSVVDAATGDAAAASGRRDVPLAAGLDGEDRDGRRGAHRRCRADLRLRTRVVAGRRAGRGRARRRRRPDAGRPVDAGRATPRRPRLADLAAQARAALGATAVTRVRRRRLASTPGRAARRPAGSRRYVTEGAVAPVDRAHGRRRAGAAGPRPARRPTRRSPPAQAFAALLQPGAAVEVVRGTAPPGAAALGEVASARRCRSSSSGCSPPATTTSPRRSPGRSRSRPGRPASFAGARGGGACSARCSTEAGVAPRRRARSSTAAGCRATTGVAARRAHPAARAVPPPGDDRRGSRPLLTGLPVGGLRRHARAALPRRAPRCRPPGASAPRPAR